MNKLIEKITKLTPEERIARFKELTDAKMSEDKTKKNENDKLVLEALLIYQIGHDNGEF